MAAENLFSVRSKTAAAAITWLKGISDTLDKTHWSHDGKRVLASDTAMDSFVFTRRRRSLNDDNRRTVTIGPQNEGFPMDETMAHLYEQPRDWEEREKQRWNRIVTGPIRRLGVRGSPGSGKSFLTQNTAVKIARECATKLGRREIPLEAAPVPFWISASALARVANYDRAAEIAAHAAMLSLSELNIRFRSAPVNWLVTAAASPEARVFVDGIDQLVRKEVKAFQRAAHLLNELPGKLLASCRTAHWDQRAGWLNWRGLVEVELAPFDPREQRLFGERFAGGTVADGLRKLVTGNPALRHACSSPLLLAFVCVLLVKGKNLMGADRATLYQEIVRLLISGEWRNYTPPWSGEGELEEDILAFLEAAAWRIFSDAPEANRFTLTEWRSAGTPPVPQMLKHLEKCGLLEQAGFDEIGDRCWSFLHRSVLEFLAARSLSRKPQEEWLAVARKHFWYEPEWIEALTFLAAHAPDATSLVEALEDQPEDIFRSMLRMRARIAGAARHVDSARIDSIVSEIAESIGQSHEDDNFWQLLPAIQNSGNGLLRESLLKSLLEMADHPDGRVRSAVAEALGLLADARAFDELLRLLEDPPARKAAVEALGNLADGRAVNHLMQIVQTWNDSARDSAAKALAKIADPRSVEPLVRTVCDRDAGGSVVSSAEDALAEMADPLAAEMLLRILQVADDRLVFVRLRAARVLVRMGEHRGAESLLSILEYRYPYRNASHAERTATHIRLGAACALAELADSRAVEPLIGHLQNTDKFDRSKAVRALGNFADTRAVEALLLLLQDESDASVLGAVADALGEIGDPRAVDPLLRLLHQIGVLPSHWAVRALGKIGDHRATDPLLGLLEDTATKMNTEEDTDFSYNFVRIRAALALGEMGDARAVEPLLQALKGPILGDEQIWTARLLGKLGDLRAIEPLLELHEHLRGFEAFTGMGRGGSHSVLMSLRRLAFGNGKTLSPQQRAWLLLKRSDSGMHGDGWEEIPSHLVN